MLQRHYQLGCPFELYGKRLEHTAHNASFVGPTSFFEQLATPRARFIDAPYPIQLRNDRNVPASILLSEFGLSDFGAAGGRTFHLQPDSSHIRVWELAGATHLETGWFQELTADASRSIPGFAVDLCANPPGNSSIIHGQAARAALDGLNDWTHDEEAPRSAPRLSLVVPDPSDS
jgi:hypothetical protein